MELRLVDFNPTQVDGHFLIQLFGVDEEGLTHTVNVNDFKPTFFVKVPDDFPLQQKAALVGYLKSTMPDYIRSHLVESGFVSRRKLYGFDAEKNHRFIYLKFQSMMAFYSVRRLWYEEKHVQPSYLYKDGVKRALKPFVYQGIRLELYEADILPLLRFFHIKEVSPSGWIRLENYEENPKTTTCCIEVTVSAKDIVPVNKETPAAYKILSFDIEANSSDGDFPMAIKDYRRLAQLIVDVGGDLKACVDAAFGFGRVAGIDLVFPKCEVTQREIDACFDQLVERSVKLSVVEAEDSDSESETFTSKYEGGLLALLQDRTATRTIKVEGLRAELNKCFPPLKGDQVTFIGSTITQRGKPPRSHCIVLGGCDPVDGVEIVACATEQEVLLEWQKLVLREDPDIVMGYNNFGFDEGFMFDRAVETGCVAQFSKLARTKDLAATFKKGEWKLQEKTIMLSSGEYVWRYFNLVGRIHLDLLMYYRKQYTYDSYKLDAVSAQFINGKVLRVEILELSTRVYTDSMFGLARNNYVKFENEFRDNKFKVSAITPDYFVIDSLVKVKPGMRWCLGKDDVDHHQIFALAKGSDADRATIAAYCVQDCNLVERLFTKTDVLTEFIEIARLCSVPINYLMERGQGAKLGSYMAKMCRQADTLMPVLPDSTGGEYEGAVVLPPKCGIYNSPVAVLDYASLYPSCICAEGMSHDSKVWTQEIRDGEVYAEEGVKVDGKFIYDNLPDYQYTQETFDVYENRRLTPKGRLQRVKVGHKIVRFAKFDGAILPSVLRGLLAARKATRKQIKSERDEFMRNILDKRQLAIKMLANSVYGQCGASTSKFYEMDVAAACTACGRKMLNYAKSMIEGLFVNRRCVTSLGEVRAHAEYVYGDTDSVFVKFNVTREGAPLSRKEALDVTIELAKLAGETASMFLKNPHELEFEYAYDPFILLSKKRYVGMVYTDGKCYRKSMGIVLKRRDNAPIVKKVYGRMIDILMESQDLPKAMAYVVECLEELSAGRCDLSNLIISKSLRSGYKNPTHIAHHVLSERIGQRDPGNKPRPGDRVQFVYVKSDPKKKLLQGEKIETPEYVVQHKLVPDYKHYITNQIMKPVLGVFELAELSMLPGFDPAEYAKKLAQEQKKFPGQESKLALLRTKELKRIIFGKYL